jgi:hypothetical protein
MVGQVASTASRRGSGACAAVPATCAMAGRARSWLGVALFASLLLGCLCARAEESTTSAENQIKAAFLVKFLGFIEWPAVLEHAGAPIVVGVMGARPVSDDLSQIAQGRPVNGHPVRVRALAPGDSLADVQVLFVGRGESAAMGSILASAQGRSLLVVTESETGLAAGSAINFVVQDDRVRFDVSLPAAGRAGLKISARLLAVARSVLPNPS